RRHTRWPRDWSSDVCSSDLPAVAGVVLAAVGEGWCFLINAISYVAVIGALAAMRVEPRRAHDAAVSAWESIVEGFQFGIRTAPEIGRASCRERVERWVGAGC